MATDRMDVVDEHLLQRRHGAESGERPVPALELPRVWRSVGLFCTFDRPEEPYLIMVSPFKDATRNGRAHVLAARVSATSWLAPLVLSPLFEHEIALDNRQTGQERPWRIDAIHGQPEFAAALFKGAAKGSACIRHNKNATEQSYFCAIKANLQEPVTNKSLNEVYETCFALMGNGTAKEWSASYMSVPVGCRAYRSVNDDPIGKWSHCDDLLVNKHGDKMDAYGPHLYCFPVSAETLWKRTRKLYRLSGDAIEKAAANLIIYNDVENTKRIYTGGDWIRESKNLKKDLKKSSSEAPRVKLLNLVMAFEEQLKDRGVLSAYALLCVDNPLRVWTTKAVLPHHAIGLAADGRGVVPPLPWFAIETPAQARELIATMTAAEYTALPSQAAMMRLFVRAAVYLSKTPCGVGGVVRDLDTDAKRTLCLDLVSSFVSSHCLRLFETSGSTARVLDIQDLMRREGIDRERLGPGVAVTRWVCGDGSSVAPPNALDIATHLVRMSHALGPLSKLPLYLTPMDKGNVADPGRLPTTPTVWCVRSGKTLNDENALVRLASSFPVTQFVLYPLVAALSGGRGALSPLEDLVRAKSITSVLIVTPLARERRVGHICETLGLRGNAADMEAVGEAVVGVADLLRSGTGNAHARIFSRTSVYVDCAHLMDVPALQQTLEFVKSKLHAESVLVVGAPCLYPISGRKSGAPFRDLLLALPAHVAPEASSALLPKEARMTEADFLTSALDNWRTWSGEPLLRIVHDKPMEGTCQLLLPEAMKFLPNTAKASQFSRTREVAQECRVRITESATDLHWKYAIAWTSVTWLGRGELLSLLSFGHPVVIYCDQDRPVRSVDFPSPPCPTTKETSPVLARLYAKQPFGTFRTTGFELHTKALNKL